MRTDKSTGSSKQRQSEENDTSDKYPDAVSGLRRVIGEATLPEGPVEWLEIQFLASGEATYRYRLPRADDVEGGYLPPPSSSS